MKRLLYGWILFFCFCMGTGGGTTVAAKDNAAVRIVHVAGQLAESRQVLLRRTLTQAATEGAPAVVVVLSVTSGQERQAQQVSAVLAASSVPTIAYVRGANSAAGTAIALSCRHIIMAPGGRLGRYATEGDTQAWRSLFENNAAATGRNRLVAAAMADATVKVPNYTASSAYTLTLTPDRAQTLGFSEGTATTVEEALQFFSLGRFRTVDVTVTPGDQLTGILQNVYVRMVLVVLIMMAILAEIKLAGIGAGMAVAVVAGIGLYVSGASTMNFDFRVMAAFMGSILCLGIELVIPGSGVFGVTGVILLYGSLFYFLGANVAAVYFLAACTVAAGVVFFLLARWLPHSRGLEKLVLHQRQQTAYGYRSQKDYSSYVSACGRTITVLRPAGIIRVDGERIDAVSTGMFIERDVAVRVLRVEGGRVVVEPLPERSL
ncbi:nodulation protein NfeD [Megasphaera lornae]|uniref:Nodulation efficiency protein D n=1 Tax=Megasphaera lornae TaxID=1000568 RepID=D3LV01_9FIRM|nr:NfeD family protein [Megasphaera genomosp. type_1]EFD93929.1 nodulation efficiency protein D [Megasphaera genomosp. type_1 str. 28L]